MRRIIYQLGLIFLCINSVFSQNLLESKLLNLEEKIYEEENDTIINDLKIDKVNLLIENKVVSSRVLSEIKRTNSTLFKNANKSNFFWNSTILFYLNDDTYNALYYLNLYEKSTIDTCTQLLILKFLINTGYNKDQSDSYLSILSSKDSLFLSFKCFNEVQEYEMRRKRIYGILGMIIPGSGLIANHEYKRGIMSLALNTGSVFAITWFFQQNMYLNMFGWGSNLITKFYIGGLNLTDKRVELNEFGKKEKLATNCELQLKTVLEKYPLNFKI